MRETTIGQLACRPSRYGLDRAQAGRGLGVVISVPGEVSVRRLCLGSVIE